MYQKLTIVGNLGRDPEMRYTPSGQAVTSFPVATNRTYTGSDGNRVKETTWFRVSAWGKQAENCNNYLKKGSKVLIEGRLNSDPTTGGPKLFSRNDGTMGTSYEVTATTVQFLDSRNEAGGDAQLSDETQSQTDDEIPF
jgi:single-strand DNA-binding protein